MAANLTFESVRIMRSFHLIFVFALSILVLTGCTSPPEAQEEASAPAPQALSDLESAMSAAPESISAAARVIG